MSAVTREESTPPERSAPRGTSESRRCSTARDSRDSNAPAASSSPPAKGAAAPSRQTLDARVRGAPQGQDGSGPEFARVRVDGVRRGDVGVAEEQGQGVAIHAPVEPGVGRQGLEFRTEDEIAPGPAVVQRLDPQAVAHQPQGPLPAVPEGQGEHARAALNGRARTPLDAGRQKGLGVRAAPEAVAQRFQFPAQVRMVVDLAVEDQDVAAVGRKHGLRAQGRKFQHGQPPMPQGQAGVRLGPDALPVRAAMGQGSGHLTGQGFRVRPARTPDSGYAAHGDAPSRRTNTYSLQQWPGPGVFRRSRRSPRRR